MVETLKRLTTGIEGLDALLKGGLLTGGAYIVQGNPGSGKTIMANQMACHHVRQGGRVLVGTLLAESHDRLFQYLSGLTFFDPALVGREIQYLSAFGTLEQEGLPAVVKLLRREIARQQASLLIIDGLLNARSRADSSLDTKKFISELQGHAAFAGCTVLLLTSSRLEEGSPEHTMVDGVIELSEMPLGSRAIRQVQLRKTRGSSALSGVHECEITQDGLQVYPRLEARYSRPSQLGEATLQRISSGTEALDHMIGGGLPEGGVTLVLGPSGIGKTSLGLSFLAAATPSAPALHFGFYETPPRLVLKAAALGFDFAALAEEGALHWCWQPTTEGLLDQVGERLLRHVDTYGIKRVLLDGLGAFGRLANDPTRLNEFYRALTSELRARNVSSMATWEMRDLLGTSYNAPAPDLSGIIDNLVLMRFVEHEARLKRVLSVVKVRDSDFDPAFYEVLMQARGLGLRRFFGGGTAIDTGLPVHSANL